MRTMKGSYTNKNTAHHNKFDILDGSDQNNSQFSNNGGVSGQGLWW